PSLASAPRRTCCTESRRRCSPPRGRSSRRAPAPTGPARPPKPSRARRGWRASFGLELDGDEPRPARLDLDLRLQRLEAGAADRVAHHARGVAGIELHDEGALADLRRGANVLLAGAELRPNGHRRRLGLELEAELPRPRLRAERDVVVVAFLDLH